MQLQDRDADRLTLTKYLARIGARVTEEETAILDGIQNTCREDAVQLGAECQDKLLAIEALSQELVLLEEVIEDRQRQFEAALSVRAPIRRLPLELLLRIFTLTMPEERQKWRVSKSPLLLCRICKQWRDIVINDPKFWCRLYYLAPLDCDHVELDDQDQRGVVKQYQYLRQGIRMFAKRSGTLPLELAFRDYADVWLQCTTSAAVEKWREAAVKEIRSHFARCISLDFATHKEWKHTLLGDLQPGAFANLESLNIDIPHSHPVPPETRLFSESSLRHYRLCTNGPSNLEDIVVPYRQLETFSLQISSYYRYDVVPKDAIQIWRNFIIKCSNLRRTAFSSDISGGLDDEAIWSSPSSTTASIQLTKLTLHLDFNACASTILRGINFPALTFLHLLATRFLPPTLLVAPPGHRFLEAIEHDVPFFAHLTTLCLTRVHIADDDLRSLLRLTTHLEFLSVLKGSFHEKRWFENSRDLVSFLTINEEDSTSEDFCPPLPTLRGIILFYNENGGGYDFPPHPSYAELSRSRYRWMLRRAGMALSNVPEGSIPFESSPFTTQIKLGGANSLPEKHAIITALQREFGPLHHSVLRTENSWSFSEENQEPRFR